MSFSGMERSNNGIHHQKQSAPGHPNAIKGKHVNHIASGQSYRPGYSNPPQNTGGKVSVPNRALLPNAGGNPSTSTSRPYTPPNPNPMDTDSDDDKPLVFRSSKTSTTNVQKRSNTTTMQVKHGPRNGVVPSAGMVRPDRTESSRCGYQASEDERPKGTSDDSEDDRPLASRIPNRQPPQVTHKHNAAATNNSDEEDDDEKPLILKRAPNGVPRPPAINKLSSGGDSYTKKRPFNDKLKEDIVVKKAKLSTPPPKTQPTTFNRPSNSTPNTLKPHSTQSLNKSIINKGISNSHSSPSGMHSKSSSSPSALQHKSHSSLSQLKPKQSSSPSGIPPKPSSSSSMLQSSKPSNSPSVVQSKSFSSRPLVQSKPSSSSVVQSKSSSLPSNAAADSASKMDIDDDEDDIPLAQRIPVVKHVPVVKKPTVVKQSGNSYSSVAAKKVIEARRVKLNQQKKLMMKKKGYKNAPGAGGGQKWTTLEHNGVIFPPPYKPHGVKMLYNGKPVSLTPEQEEVATMFAVMRETDYVKKPKFLSNFWADWKKILGPGHVIQNLEGCDFTPIYEWHVGEKEKKKLLSSEEKKRLKEEKQKLEEKYMWALVDGVKEKVGNFRVEPPGLFRGRGEHPKMGKLKRRIFPEDIVINIAKGVPVPECPMPGHRWKEIRHDDTVTWLAYWVDPINQREFKYVFLAASSSLKGQSDKEKYEKARKLKDYIEDIRKTYTKHFTSSDMTKKQIAVATYLIDRLALRAGNEKDDDEADTVGCCSLKVEHVTLVPPKSLQFDFLGKDSIRYFNTVEVLEPVYKAIGEFKKAKKAGDDLFDKLDTSKLNAHLKDIMPQLTAKVFRTYNASITLDKLLVDTDGQSIQEKIAAYQGANKEVALLCNHQRSVSKSHEAQMEKLESKMGELEGLLCELRVDLDRAVRCKPPLKDSDGKPKRNQSPEALEKKIAQTEQKIEKMKLDMRIKDDLKTVALGTSKINYMDPRITVAWCKRHEVPIEKIFNKSLLAKFAWAMDVDMDYRF